MAAERAGGAFERDLAVGRTRVRLRFTGEALARRLLPALAHLVPAGPGEPSLTLCVWDSASTGVRVPPFSWRPRDLGPRGEVAGHNDARFRTAYHGDVTDPSLGFNALSMFDAGSRTGIFWVAGIDRLPWTESAEPLRPLLHWGLMDDSSYLVHAGAVANDDGGVLLAGRGGSGKSTSALACVEAGFGFLSDNYVVMTRGEEPMAHSLYCTAKARSEGLPFHAGLRGVAQDFNPVGDEKFVLDLNLHLQEQLVLQAPVKAVLLPTLSDSGRVSIRPTSPTEGLLALAPSTIYGLPGSRGAMLEPMTELVKQIPTYALELGGPPSEVAGEISDLLDSLS